MSITIILILLSILPTVVLCNIVYNMDRVEKESKNLLTSLFLSGIAIVFLVLTITELLEMAVPFFAIDLGYLSRFQMFISIFIGVALIEEGCKWVVFKNLAWKHKEFDYMFDAMVYSIFISLGFATVENLLYVIEGGIWVALIRAVCSVPGHMFFATYMGYYFGLAKQAQINKNQKIKIRNIILSIAMPTILHTIFNYCLYTSDPVILVGYIIFVIFLYISSFKKLKQVSKIRLSMDQEI